MAAEEGEVAVARGCGWGLRVPGRPGRRSSSPSRACPCAHLDGALQLALNGKHFKPSLKLIRMRPRTASNHCKHRQPQTSKNHEQNRLKAAASKSSCFKHSACGTKKPRLQPTSQPQPTKTKQPTHRPTDRRTGHSQSAQPANQPTNQQASQSGRLAARAPLSQHPENKRPAAFQNLSRLPKLEPLSAPQNEVHNL